MKENSFNGISNSEIIWVQHVIDNEVKYITTSDKSRTVYYLYEYSAENDRYIKTSHQSNDPVKLAAKYIKRSNTK